jgi:hypothetical protein
MPSMRVVRVDRRDGISCHCSVPPAPMRKRAARLPSTQSEVQSQPTHLAPGGCGTPARFRKLKRRSSAEKLCRYCTLVSNICCRTPPWSWTFAAGTSSSHWTAWVTGVSLRGTRRWYREQVEPEVTVHVRFQPWTPQR